MINMKKRWIVPSFENESIIVKKQRTENSISFETSIPIPAKKPTNSVISGYAWCERYKPKNIKELVVNSKKVTELQEWFRRHNTANNNKYLILTGPSGCGKTVTLQLTAELFGVHVNEWITPLDRDYESYTYCNVVQLFKDFLMKTSRYPSLLCANNSSTITLVKDFPNAFLCDPSKFHSLLEECYDFKSHPVVFVLSDENIVRKLFPRNIRENCGIEVINFNALTKAATVKALKVIVDAEKKIGNIERNKNICLDSIYMSSGGDLRSAILKLYFNASNWQSNDQIDSCWDKSIEKKNSFTKVKQMKMKNTTECDKDEVCDLFRGLGRVLYSKRDTNQEGQGKHNCSGDSYKFIHNPDEIADGFLSQPSNFVSFLQENYLSRFSDIYNISKAADKLSMADSLSHGTNYEEMNKIALSVAIRGLMTANNNPIKSFKPFVRPYLYSRQFTVDINDVRNVFPDLQCSFSEFILEYLLLLRSNYHRSTESQKDVLKTLSLTNLT